jgi:hypothetical protein
MERIKENKEERETLEAFANLSLAQMKVLMEEKKKHQQDQRDSKQFKQIVENSIKLLNYFLRENDFALVDVCRAIAESRTNIEMTSLPSPEEIDLASEFDKAIAETFTPEEERIVVPKTTKSATKKPIATTTKPATKKPVTAVKKSKQLERSARIKILLEFAKTHLNQKFKLSSLYKLFEYSRQSYKSEDSFKGSVRGLTNSKPFKKNFHVKYGYRFDVLGKGTYRFVKT